MHNETDHQRTILDRIADFVRRFVTLPDETYYTLVAAWILGTYLLEEFEYFGYLFACSNLPQSGKTKLLEVLNALVFEPSGILVSPTEAILFRTAQRTQLIDEIDSHLNVEALRSVLNAGYQKGASVERCSNIEGDYIPKKYLVYGGRAMAGISEKTLHDTTRQRTFTLMMTRQPRDKRERFRTRVLAEELTVLRAGIEQWVTEHRPAVENSYSAGDFHYLDQFDDRTLDVSESLAAIVEVACAGDPSANDARAALVIAIGKTRQLNEDLAADRQLIGQLLELTEGVNPLVGTATELAGCLNGTISMPIMSATLRRYGFETRSIRLGGTPKHRYSLDRAALSDVRSRYFGEEPTTAREGV